MFRKVGFRRLTEGGKGTYISFMNPLRNAGSFSGIKTLHVPKIEFDEDGSLSELSARLDSEGVWEALDAVPWSAYPYKPVVRFGIAHTGRSVCVKYRVEERAVIAEKTETNTQVSEDSCVELFLAPVGDGLYYNFEWNCIGTCLAGVGSERHGRELLDPREIEKIRRFSTLGGLPFGERTGRFEWSLIAVVPVFTLHRHSIADLTGTTATGNLFKCGDHLTTPHYVTWNPIESPGPDYHRPEQFGRILFEE